MKIFTHQQFRDIVERTIRDEGVTLLDLIENAAEAIANEIMLRWRPSERLLVFAGWSDNGAEALGAARLLAQQGYNPEVYLFNIHNKITPECRVCRDRLLACQEQFKLFEIDGRERFSWPEFNKNCLIIDGLFGSDLQEQLPVPFQLLIGNINNSGAEVVSIDVPSGMFSEWNQGVSLSHKVHATLTLALGVPRLAFFIADNAEAVGEWRVLDIGLSVRAIREAPYSYYLVQNNTVRQFLPARNPNCCKADFGNTLICAGSEGMMGAAVLAACGALRSGSGKVTVHSARCGLDILQTAVPSAMFHCDNSNRYITAFPTDNSQWSAIGVGPGIGTAEATIDALEHFLKTRSAMSAPVVLDADALNCMALRPILLDYLPVLSVLTPHAGEFDRLFGAQPSHEARLRKAIEVAHFHRVIIVLKGRFTAIVRPDGKIFFNSSGSPAMSTGGSGDVLTGIITGLMAQGYKPEKATFIGCYIHGVAGEIACARNGEYGTTSGDIADCIGRAIMQIQA